jgi:hypothetical protein
MRSHWSSVSRIIRHLYIGSTAVGNFEIGSREIKGLCVEVHEHNSL